MISSGNKDCLSQYTSEEISAMKEKSKLLKSQKEREWRKKNKDKLAKYYEMNKENLSIKKAKYYQENKDEIAERNALYYRRNKVKIDSKYHQRKAEKQQQLISKALEKSKKMFEASKKFYPDRCKSLNDSGLKKLEKFKAKLSEFKEKNLDSKTTEICTSALEEVDTTYKTFVEMIDNLVEKFEHVCYEEENQREQMHDEYNNLLQKQIQPKWEELELGYEIKLMHIADKHDLKLRCFNCHWEINCYCHGPRVIHQKKLKCNKGYLEWFERKRKVPKGKKEKQVEELSEYEKIREENIASLIMKRKSLFEIKK